MTFTSVLAQATVTELAAAAPWYTTLFGRGPDGRPMDGLLQWQLTASAGVQVWAEPQRAGRSTLVLVVDDLDAVAARLTAAGIGHGSPEPGGGGRVLQLTDPHGNRVVLTGS